MTSTTLPTTEQELNRKTVDFLEDLHFAMSRNDIDPLVASVQCKAVWTVTAGLVDNDISGMLTETASMLGAQPVKIFFAGHGKLRLLAYPARGAGFVLLEIDATSNAKSVLIKSATDGNERAQALAKTIEALKAKGYVRH
jgi:hypothetical protein